MIDPLPPLPSPEEARAIHTSLLAGSRAAATDLAEAYFDWLWRWLWRSQRGRYPRLEEDQCCQAAGEAIRSLATQPAAYDPDRLGLEAYLKMAAARDLQNLLRSERRHQIRRVDLAAVADSRDAGKYLRDDAADPALIIEQEEDEDERASELGARAVVAANGLNAGEARALALLRQGERKTAVYAAALDIAHLPISEQQRQVKRVKDKLMKRLQRAGDTA